MTEAFTVRAATGGASLAVRKIHTWNRGQTAHHEEQTFRAWTHDLFESHLATDRVMLVRASGPPFLLLHTSDGWSDVTGKAVILAPVAVEESEAA